MPKRSRLPKRDSNRRAGGKAKVTFKTFTASIRPHDLGERAMALETAERQSKRALSTRAKIVVFGPLVILAVFGSTVAVFKAIEVPTNLPSSQPAHASEAECDFSFAGTSVESRSKVVFGGVIVETGETECDEEYFIVTQTSNTEGEVLSRKKKRA